jgi:anti-anti-sigma factor
MTPLKGIGIVRVGMPSVRERQAAVLRERLLLFAEDFDGSLAVSLSEVTVLTSAGINALVEGATACDFYGGRMVLFALKPGLRRVFKTTGLDRVLRVEKDCGRALAAVREVMRNAA